jgi:hypothetical protein
MVMEGPRALQLANAPIRLDDHCNVEGCAEESGIRCNYVDWRGKPCRTSWCFAHWKLVRGKPYCRRHATVIEALDGESAVGGLPDLATRAASLAGWMGRELEAPVRGVLQSVAAGEGARVISEPLRPALTPGAGRRWQRAWTLADDSGVLNRVSVEVEEHDDSEVIVRVDGKVIGQGIPPWIQSGGASEPERREFRNAIARSIELVLTGRELVRVF